MIDDSLRTGLVSTGRSVFFVGEYQRTDGKGTTMQTNDDHSRLPFAKLLPKEPRLLVTIKISPQWANWGLQVKESSRDRRLW